MVKKGDGVREGDVLVSGIMDSAYGGFRLVHSFTAKYMQELSIPPPGNTNSTILKRNTAVRKRSDLV